MGTTTAAARLSPADRLTAADADALDALVTGTGAVNLANNTTIVARNAANSANVELARVNASDERVFGGAKLLPVATWVPSIAPDAGAFGGVPTIVSARWQQTGGLIHFTLTIVLPALGSAIGAFTFTLPAAASGHHFSSSGINATSLVALACFYNSGAGTVRCARYDGASSMVEGSGYVISGTYEAASL